MKQRSAFSYIFSLGTKMIIFILLFLVGLLVIAIIWWYIIYLKYEFYLKKFDGPTPLPIIGTLHMIGTENEILHRLSQHFENYGEPTKFILGYSPRLVLAGAKSVEFLLSSNTIIKKAYEYKYFHSWLGMGLLTSYGARWRQHRKFLTPAFHFNILERFISVFNDQSNILIKKLQDTTKDKAVDVFPYITLHALDVICEATMNTSLNAQTNSNTSYVKSVKQICRIVVERALSFKMFDLVYRFSKDYYIEKKALVVLHGLSNSVIKNRKKELENLDITDISRISELGSKKRVAFLDLLLTSNIGGSPLTHEEIREEVDTFMFEGHDTTTSAISFTLYCLSKNQGVQAKVYNEISELVGINPKSVLTYDDLQKMKYLEQVIKESMRMYPPVPFFSRVLTEDAMFEGKVIPKGVALIVSVYHLHRNPELFPHPNVFDPERFNSKNISVYSYVPFSAGPRNCIGQKFAMLEMKATVCKIIQAFKLLPVLNHEPLLIPHTILTSKNGLPVRFQQRK